MNGTSKAVLLTGLATLVAAGILYSGLINVGADDPHLAPVYALLNMARERSIAIRARGIVVPDLGNEAQIREGAGNYDSMCVGCHLSPGMAPTELSRNLYPAPPSLVRLGVDGDPAKAFWIIKHGIKATGMPAWGKSMADEHIWALVAFIERLPQLDPQSYRALVASSGGHRHGGGETQIHHRHADDLPAEDHDH
jgi:mono/diheme cytochrome c family protein